MSWRKLLSSSIAVCPPWPYQSKFPFGEFSTLVDTGCAEGDAVISRSQGRRMSPWDSWTTTQQAKPVIEKVQFNIKITQKIHVMLPHWLVLPELLLTKLHEISVFQVRPDWGGKKKKLEYWNFPQDGDFDFDLCSNQDNFVQKTKQKNPQSISDFSTKILLKENIWELLSIQHRYWTILNKVAMFSYFSVVCLFFFNKWGLGLSLVLIWIWTSSTGWTRFLLW